MVEITKVYFKRGTSRRSLNKKDIVVSTSSKSEDFRLFQIVGERYLDICFRASSLNPNLWDQEWHSGDKARPPTIVA